MIYWCATTLVLFLLSWCALFYFFISLQVLYLDSLDTGFKRISTRGCRVSVWTTKLVIKAIAKDTKPDGSFGALQVCHFVNYIHFPFFSFVIFFILCTKPFYQLKSEFTGQDNILFGHHVPLEDFINTHVHESFGNQVWKVCFLIVPFPVFLPFFFFFLIPMHV